MKSIVLFFLKVYFNLFSSIFPNLLTKQALTLFQKPSHRALKANEKDFFAKANHFKVKYSEELLDAYELGAENKKLILLIHGWSSNLGRLSKIAFRLEKEGYRVVGINFPAHGDSKIKETNMVSSSNALKALIKHLDIKDTFSVVSHSFGSGTSALTLMELNLKVDKLIYLTSANRIEDIFLDFKKMIHLPESIYKRFVSSLESRYSFTLKELNVVDFLGKIKYEKLLLIHDKYDKILPYEYATQIAENTERSELMTLEHKGHSGMLFQEDVIEKVVSFLKS